MYYFWTAPRISIFSVDDLFVLIYRLYISSIIISYNRLRSLSFSSFLVCGFPSGLKRYLILTVNVVSGRRLSIKDCQCLADLLCTPTLWHVAGFSSSAFIILYHVSVCSQSHEIPVRREIAVVVMATA